MERRWLSLARSYLDLRSGCRVSLNRSGIAARRTNRPLYVRDEQERRHLAQADRHIPELKDNIARQRKIIKELVEKGRPTELAETMLDAMEVSLNAFELADGAFVTRPDARGRP